MATARRGTGAVAGRRIDARSALAAGGGAARTPCAAGLAVLAVAALLGGCGGGGQASNPYPQGTLPPNPGAICDDDAGDLSRVAGELGGTLQEPSGADLVHAEAHVTDTGLSVSFTMAGPVAAAPHPELRLGQGPAGQLQSFELVVSPGEGTGWQVRLVTFRPDGRGGIQEAPRVVLPTPVRVDGDTVAFDVAARYLPRIATYVWLFGSSSSADPGGDDTVIDDCDHRPQPVTPVPPASPPSGG